MTATIRRRKGTRLMTAAACPGLDFFNTGVSLVTDKPVAGVPSISSKEGLAKCWG